MNLHNLKVRPDPGSAIKILIIAMLLMQTTGCAGWYEAAPKPTELGSVLAGNSLVHDDERTGFKRYFDANGTHVFDPDRGFYQTGYWFVGTETNKLCDWEVSYQKPRCAEVRIEGDRLLLDYGGDSPYQVRLVDGDATDPSDNPGPGFDPSLELSNYQLRDLRISPAADDLPAQLSDFLGGWYGTWYAFRDFAIVIDHIDRQRAELIYAWGPNKSRNDSQAGSRRATGKVNGESIEFNLWDNSARLRIRADGHLEIDWESEDWSGRGIASRWPDPPWRTDTAKVLQAPDPGSPRTELELQTLLEHPEDLGGELVHNDYFKALGPGIAAAHHAFQGQIEIQGSRVLGRPAGNRGGRDYPGLPELSLEFFTFGDALVPDRRHQLITDGKAWELILEPGRVWSEPGDNGWSRAAFPFSLVEKGDTLLRNGVATFVYNATQMSAIRFQVTRESSHFGQLDLWGYATASLERREPDTSTATVDAYRVELSNQIDIRPWRELQGRLDQALLDRFDGKRIRREISRSGLIIGDRVYATDCRTRYGPHPYCRHMRHAVYSVSKSLGGWLTALRLAEKYGAEIMDYKVSDFVDLKTDNPDWKLVTFEHLLSMVSGIGEVAPQRVSYYVETYGSPGSIDLHRAGTSQQKLAVIERVGFYPWKAGEVFRYAAYDPVLLAMALSELYRRKAGPEADLWEMMQREVFQPIGISNVPIRSSIEDHQGRRIPMFGYGMFITLEETAKMISLIRSQGRVGDHQLLHAGLLRQSLRPDVMEYAYPTNWKTNTGGETHYFRSLWIAPYPAMEGCTVPIPQMSGAGGNAVVLMPNGITALRFASGPDEDDDNDTWDQTPMIQAADAIRSLCAGGEHQ